MRILSIAAVALPLLTAGCAAAHTPAAAAPVFRPEVWFVGEMHSVGELKAMARPPHGLRVDSTGRTLADGAVRLDQAIHWAGGTTDHRFWIMRPTSGGGYTVTLSDARGPVFFETHGAQAHLRYRDKRGPLPLTVEQWMDLQPDGRTLDNRGVLSILGFPIAHLNETIVHAPA